MAKQFLFRNFLHASLGILLLVSFGCGDGLPSRAPVSGKVMLDGQPAANAKITFMPVDGSRVANGLTDSTGAFSSVTTFGSGDGAILGEHQVAITPKDPPPMPGDEISSPGGREKRVRYQSPIPTKYGDPKKSGLTASVKSSGNNFTFELDSK
ncbi:MAG: hypothetical protein AAFN77_23520 [Planctomycetota bacterium]